MVILPNNTRSNIGLGQIFTNTSNLPSGAAQLLIGGRRGGNYGNLQHHTRRNIDAIWTAGECVNLEYTES